VNPRSRRLARIGTILAVSLGLFFLAVPLLAGPIGRVLPHSALDPIGRETIEAVRGEAQFCNAEAGTAALDRLTDRLAAKSGLSAPVRVYVVDDDVLNAFAAPGNHIVIYRRIVAEAHDPNELAGVLAHEMAHEIEGHPGKGVVEMLGYGVFGLLTPGGGNVGKDVAAQIITSTYSRNDELAADHRGVQLLNDAGIDSRGLARFFDTMKDEGGDVPGALEFLSTHPTGERRQDAVKDHERAGEAAMSDADWQALRSICERTTAEPASVGT